MCLAKFSSKRGSYLHSGQRSSFQHLTWYAGKAEIREFLRELNKDRKNLEYSLFLTDLFTNHFVYPCESAKHFRLFGIQVDFNKRRTLTQDGGDDYRITLITVHGLAKVVVRGIEYKYEWPVIGDIKGTELSRRQLLAVSGKVRGGQPFHIERLRTDDLNAGVLKCSWLLTVDYLGIPREKAEALMPTLVAGMLLSISTRATNVTDEWHRLFPDHQLTQAEKFLAEAWRDKP